MGWYEVYQKDIEKKGTYTDYINKKIETKKELTDLIKKYAKNKKILEAGSGTAVVSTYMASIGYDSYAIDIDDKILELSKQIAKEYNAAKKPKFVKKSIFELDYKKNYFDVSFSNGVLEHFSDSEIINTLKQQMNIAKIVIVGIPTRYFDRSEAMYGDERYMPIKFWRKMINQAGGKILEEKSNHYLSFKERIFKFKKYFRPYPFRIFVITKK